MPTWRIIAWFILVAAAISYGIHWAIGEGAEWLKNLSGAGAAWLRGIGFILVGGAIAPVGIFLANQRTKNESARRITDAFTKAVELLGDDSTAVRQGGIYALGRIAYDHPDEHPKIMDIVAAYIRDKSKQYIDKERKERNETREAAIERIAKKDPMPIDLEAAVAVIRERLVKFDRPRTGKRRYIFDLSNSFLFNADFSRTSLKGVNLSDCLLHDCVFEGTPLTGSNLASSNLAKSNFKEVDVKEAEFNAANISGVDLREVRNLTQKQVDSANGDEHTKFPANIKWLEK